MDKWPSPSAGAPNNLGAMPFLACNDHNMSQQAVKTVRRSRGSNPTGPRRFAWGSHPQTGRCESATSLSLRCAFAGPHPYAGHCSQRQPWKKRPMNHQKRGAGNLSPERYLRQKSVHQVRHPRATPALPGEGTVGAAQWDNPDPSHRGPQRCQITLTAISRTGVRSRQG